MAATWLWAPEGPFPILLGFLVACGVYLAVVVHAWLLAGRQPAAFELRPYNRWYVYVVVYLLVSVILGSSLQDQLKQRLEAFRIPSGAMEPTLLIGDYLYLMTDAGLTTCLDAHTGVPKYEGKRFKTPAKFMAPPIVADGMMLVTSQDGDTHILKAGPEFEELADNPVDEPVYAGLALSKQSIYIRSAKHLYCIRKPN